MRAMGLQGAVRGRAWVTTTQPAPTAQGPQGLVTRAFTATRSNQLWVSHFTYVATWQASCVAFIADAFARRSSAGVSPSHGAPTWYSTRWAGGSVQDIVARMMRAFRLTTGAAIAAIVLALGVGQATAGQGKERRITGAALVAHPVAALAAQYLDLLHGGNMDAVMALATNKAQAEFKAEPASEQKASADFRRRMLPTRAEFDRSLAKEGVLIIEADGTATLNLVKATPATGSGAGSSTTVAMPFAMEDGKWRIAR